MKKNNFKTFIIPVLSFIILWLGTLLSLRFFETPYFWIILLLIFCGCSFFAIKKNKIIGIILTIVTLLFICLLSFGLKQLYCYGSPDNERVNEMIDITSLSEEEKSRYIWSMDNYQPGQKLVINQGFKAMSDCNTTHTPLTMIKEIFTKNW